MFKFITLILLTGFIYNSNSLKDKHNSLTTYLNNNSTINNNYFCLLYTSPSPRD